MVKDIVPDGKLVKLTNEDLFLDVSTNSSGSFDVNRVHRQDGSVLKWGSEFGGRKVNEAFMDGLCDELARGKFQDVEGSAKLPRGTTAPPKAPLQNGLSK